MPGSHTGAGDAAPALQIHGVHKRYGRKGPWVLDGIDLSVPRGSLFGLLGPNGAGKSTLIRIITGLSGADAGEIAVNGHAVPAQLDAAARSVGLAPQSLAFYPKLSVAENLDFFAALRLNERLQRKQAVEEALAVTQLTGFRAQRAGALSGGLQRRLNLAIALLGHPSLLILDEPTVGVDPQSRGFILDSLRALNRDGMTILYTTHYMDEVQRLCDRLAILDQGRLLRAGTLQDVIGEADDLESAFLALTGHALRDH